MPRTKRWYRLEAGRLTALLERLSLRDGLLLWEALGEDPRAFPSGKAEALKKAKQRIRGDRMSPGITRNEGTKCPATLRAGERKPLAKKEKRGDRVSPGKRGNQGTERPRYPDPAGALAQELGGWRAGLLYRARKEQNPLIQRLAHEHRESLLDENLEAAILRGLLRVRPGLDVVRVVDVGLVGALDPAVLAWAAEQGRVVVSRDRATMSLEAARRIEAGAPMPGLLLIRRGVSIGEVLRTLAKYCARWR